MTNRSAFNRTYTSFQSDGTEVYLVNGTGAGAGSPSTGSKAFTAGQDLIQGAAVYVSGIYVFNANAASGIAQFNYNPIGLTSESAVTNAQVTVILDDLASVTSANLYAETALEPGEYYFLAREPGKLTKYSTASGTVGATDGYGALVNLGTAVSTTELSIELQPIVELYGPGNTGPIPAPIQRDFTAGEDLIQGEIVFVSGVYAVPATAASGVPAERHSAIGATTQSATANNTVSVIFDDVVSLAGGNITAESELTPGQYYYLSKEKGQVTRFTTSSGSISASDGYAVLGNLGIALSVNAFHMQIQPPTDLYA